MTQKTINKAAALVRSGCVTRLPGIGGGVRLWLVVGERADYMVATRGESARCGCPAGIHGKHCSHGLAAIFMARTAK